MMHEWNHSWEISVDTACTLKRLINCEQAMAMYKEILTHTQGRIWWADQVYCYALRMARVFPHITNFLSKDPNVGNFSYTGGKFAHIHYTSHDQNKPKWEHLTNTIDQRVSKPSSATSQSA